MNTMNNFLLSLFFLATVPLTAQTKINSDAKITLEFEGSSDIYECHNVYYQIVAGKKTNYNYDITLNCNEIANKVYFKWAANPDVLKNIKITVSKSGKKQREYLLKNTTMKIFSEIGYVDEEAEPNDYGSYNLTLEAEQIIINGILMKPAK